MGTLGGEVSEGPSGGQRRRVVHLWYNVTMGSEGSPGGRKEEGVGLVREANVGRDLGIRDAEMGERHFY